MSSVPAPIAPSAAHAIASQAAALPSAGTPSAAISHVPAWIPHWLADGWPADYLPPLIALAAFGLSFVVFLSAKRRERFKLGIDLILKLGERFESAAMREHRAAAALALRKSDEGDIPALDSVLDFFEDVAFLVRRGAVDVEAVYEFFSHWIEIYARASAEYRRSDHGSLVWEGFERLIPTLEQFEDCKLSAGIWRLRLIHAVAWHVGRKKDADRTWRGPTAETDSDLRLEQLLVEPVLPEAGWSGRAKRRGEGDGKRLRSSA